MRLLLDTHTWLWFGTGSPRLHPDVRERLTVRSTQVWVSVVSLWELVLKVGAGKLTLAAPAEASWFEQTTSAGFRALDVTAAHVLGMQGLPALHRDPFDRMLIAQAQAEGLTLVTADSVVRAYPVATLNASSAALASP